MANPAPATWNGNGNGSWNNDLACGASNQEGQYGWQQLANAGLVEGTYVGFASPSGCFAVDGDRCPVAKVNKTMRWTLATYTSVPSGNFNGNYMHTLMLDFSSKGLTPTEIWGIDTKMDDGMPATGKVSVRTPFTPFGTTVNQCTTATLASDMTATYLLTSEVNTCGIFFRQLRF